jgi:hypothetical protein
LENFQPVELGYDQRSGNLYDNKDFLINCVNYLLDDTDLLTFEVKILICLIDKEKVYENYTQTQIQLSILIYTFGVVVFPLRKYSK